MEAMSSNGSISLDQFKNALVNANAEAENQVKLIADANGSPSTVTGRIKLQNLGNQNSNGQSTYPLSPKGDGVIVVTPHVNPAPRVPKTVSSSVPNPETSAAATPPSTVPNAESKSPSP